MSLILPNLPKLQQQDPKLGEALKAVQDFVGRNVATVQGNRKAPPKFLHPGQPPV
jgi:hypothetical protein